MRKGLIILAAICLFLAVVPAAFAKDTSDDWTLNGKWSVGAGGGWSDHKIGPFVVSGKYWAENWEVGAEAFTSLESESKDYDQIGQAWIAYRYDVIVPDDPKEGTTYIGIGASGVFKPWDKGADQLSNSFGPIAIAGWDSDNWGVELKGAYYDPFVVSGVVYYHFTTNEK